jgi:hypothetical protein
VGVGGIKVTSWGVGGPTPTCADLGTQSQGRPVTNDAQVRANLTEQPEPQGPGLLEWWCDLRGELDQRHVAAKDSQRAIIELAGAYGRIPTDQRLEVNEVLLEWVLADDEGLRFDALAIVNEYKITEAAPAL